VSLMQAITVIGIFAAVLFLLVAPWLAILYALWPLIEESDRLYQRTRDHHD